MLRMVRILLNETSEYHSIAELQEFPVTIIKLVAILYTIPELKSIFSRAEVLTGLAATLFPILQSTSSTKTSPDDESQQEINGLGSGDSPARRNIMEFLCNLLLDSLTLPPPQKQSSALDCLLNVQPENSALLHQKRFQAELLAMIMDHLVSTETLIGDKSALPILKGGDTSNIIGNLFYLAHRLVDKLWQEVLEADANDLFKLILAILSQTRKHSDWISLEGIYRSLNRTVLYLLSKQCGTAQLTAGSDRPQRGGHNNAIHILDQLIANRSLLFGRENTEIEFFGCLTFCLINLAEGTLVPLQKGNISLTKLELSNQDQHKLKLVANKVWEDLFFNKKSAIEEVSKVSFPYSNRSPSLESARDLLYESIDKLWFQYLGKDMVMLYT